jgi:hypothetical protein
VIAAEPDPHHLRLLLLCAAATGAAAVVVNLNNDAANFEFKRSIETILGAAVCGGFIVGDLCSFTQTGIAGLLASGTLCGAYYMLNLRPVPVIGDNYLELEPWIFTILQHGEATKSRWRFIDTSPQMMMALGLREYDSVLKTRSMLPDNHSYTKLCRHVGNRLAEAGKIDLPCGLYWEFNVIDDDDVNAFVLPNCGKVFVHRGLIKLLNTPEELAVILSHELAHEFASHSAERLSMQRFQDILILVWASLVGVGAGYIGTACELLVRNPCRMVYSQTQHTRAPHTMQFS